METKAVSLGGTNGWLDVSALSDVRKRADLPYCFSTCFLKRRKWTLLVPGDFTD